MMFPKRSAPSTRTSRGVVAAAIFGGLLGSGLTLSLISSPDFHAPEPLSRVASMLQPEEAAAHYPAVDLAEIVERATKSVVNISSTKLMKGGGEGDGSP